MALTSARTTSKRQTKRVEELTGCVPPRIMLHAWKLAFAHPRTERLLSFEAPVPFDVKGTLGCLRKAQKRA